MSSRRILGLRKKQRRKEKRQKNILLTEDERRRLVESKENQRTNSDYLSVRGLGRINREHKKNFVEIVLDLAKKFPNQQIQVLDEGAGRSQFHKGLVQEARLGERLKVVRTDIDKKLCEANGLVHASPEELVSKFGRNRFHLIVSSFSGVTFTKVNQANAIANIIESLKPGGIASIETGFSTSGGGKITVARIKKILKNYPNAFVTENQLSKNSTMLTIRKT